MSSQLSSWRRVRSAGVQSQKGSFTYVTSSCVRREFLGKISHCEFCLCLTALQVLPENNGRDWPSCPPCHQTISPRLHDSRRGGDEYSLREPTKCANMTQANSPEAPGMLLPEITTTLILYIDKYYIIVTMCHTLILHIANYYVTPEVGSTLLYYESQLRGYKMGNNYSMYHNVTPEVTHNKNDLNSFYSCSIFSLANEIGQHSACSCPTNRGGEVSNPNIHVCALFFQNSSLLSFPEYGEEKLSQCVY